MITDEAVLVERLQKGDLEAFDNIYNIYAPKLYAFGNKYLKSESEAEEIVQSVFLKVWEGHKKLDKELSFKSYLFTIAYNDICKLFRRRKYLQKYVSDTLYENRIATSRTEEGIDYKSALDQVQLIISQLPENHKAAFIKNRIDGKSTKEIAAELGLSPGTVDNYVSETLKFISARLHKDNLPVMLLISLFLI